MLNQRGDKTSNKMSCKTINFAKNKIKTGKYVNAKRQQRNESQNVTQNIS